MTNTMVPPETIPATANVKNAGLRRRSRSAARARPDGDGAAVAPSICSSTTDSSAMAHSATNEPANAVDAASLVRRASHGPRNAASTPADITQPSARSRRSGGALSTAAKR